MARRKRNSSAKKSPLAREIRAVRDRLKLSQGGFAQHVGVSQQTISDWERGRRLRQLEVAIRLSRFLDQVRTAPAH